MSKDQKQFQKAFVAQMRATLKGDIDGETKARQLVNHYRRKIKS